MIQLRGSKLIHHDCSCNNVSFVDVPEYDGVSLKKWNKNELPRLSPYVHSYIALIAWIGEDCEFVENYNTYTLVNKSYEHVCQ